MSASIHDQAAAESFLADLGDTANEVADSLRQMSVKGTPGNPCECPVARAMDTRLGGEWSVINRATKFEAGVEWEDRVKVTVPDPVRKFIMAFDKHGSEHTEDRMVGYEDLIDPDTIY